MQLQEITFDDQPPVDSYGPGFFRVEGEVFEGNLFLSGRVVKTWAGYDDLVPLVAGKGGYDVVFIGTGAEISPLPKPVRAALEAENVPFEVMATPSACRTYNVLLSENRRVAVAALAV
jgi:uncharacterized protein